MDQLCARDIVISYDSTIHKGYSHGVEFSVYYQWEMFLFSYSLCVYSTNDIIGGFIHKLYLNLQKLTRYFENK